MDVFFFVTTILVIILGLGAVICYVYIVSILKDIKHISNKAKIESEHLAEDIGELRNNVKQQGAKIKYFAKFFTNMYKRNKR